MEGLSDELKCPVCFEIPKAEVFQCENGHSVCSDCVASMTKCPQCRAPYETKLIRNRTLEGILERLQLDCDYIRQGCNVKLTRQNIAEHTKNCKYGAVTVKLCKQLGWNCKYKVRLNDTPEALVHFQQEHQANVEICTKFSISIEADITSSAIKCYWRPAILDAHGEKFLVRLVQLEDKSLSMYSIRVTHATCQPTKNFRAEFILPSPTPSQLGDLVWSGPPLDIKHSLEPLNYSLFRFPHQLWKLYKGNGIPKISGSIELVVAK